MTSNMVLFFLVKSKVKDREENKPLPSSVVGITLTGMASNRYWGKSLHYHIVHNFSCDSQQYFTL